MAFSTQKEFFTVSFFDETPSFECVDKCLRLKSYGSAIDDRSWAAGDSAQSKYLSDLVTCHLPNAGASADDSTQDSRGRSRQSGKSSGSRSASVSGYPSASGYSVGASSGRSAGTRTTGAFSELDGLNIGDSLLECANENLARLEQLLKEKDGQLEASRECLRNAKDENNKIKEILKSSFDSCAANDLKNLLQKLSCSGNLDKNDEKQINCLIKKLENLGKSIEIIKSENSFLKRLVQKLQCRIGIDDLKIEKETCTDVKGLQKKIDKLQKELCILRKYENEALKMCKAACPGDDYVCHVQAIVQERDELRQRCDRLKGIEHKLAGVQNVAKNYECKAGCLKQELDKQSKYICEVEKQMKCMSDFYENKLTQEKHSENDLKNQVDQFMCELGKARNQNDCLRSEVCCLRDEITKRDVAISDYECQYKQLMYKIKIFKSYGYRMPTECELNNAIEQESSQEFCHCQHG